MNLLGFWRCAYIGGSVGPTGATGAMGPGVMMSELYLYNYCANHFSPHAAIKFDQPPVPGAAVPGMVLVGDDTVKICAKGLYRVDYSFTPYSVNTTLAVFLDGVEIPGSRYTSEDAPVAIHASVVFEVNCGMPGLLQLRNVRSTHDAELVVASMPNTVNASLLVSAIMSV